MARMRWEHLPARTSVSMSKADVEKLRGSGAKNFVAGMVTGACLLLFVQGTTTVEVDKPDKPVTPTVSATVNASNN